MLFMLHAWQNDEAPFVGSPLSQRRHPQNVRSSMAYDDGWQFVMARCFTSPRVWRFAWRKWATNEEETNVLSWIEDPVGMWLRRSSSPLHRKADLCPWDIPACQRNLSLGTIGSIKFSSEAPFALHCLPADSRVLEKWEKGLNHFTVIIIYIVIDIDWNQRGVREDAGRSKARKRKDFSLAVVCVLFCCFFCFRIVLCQLPVSVPTTLGARGTETNWRRSGRVTLERARKDHPPPSTICSRWQPRPFAALGVCRCQTFPNRPEPKNAEEWEKIFHCSSPSWFGFPFCYFPSIPLLQPRRRTQVSGFSCFWKHRKIVRFSLYLSPRSLGHLARNPVGCIKKFSDLSKLFAVMKSIRIYWFLLLLLLLAWCVRFRLWVFISRFPPLPGVIFGSIGLCLCMLERENQGNFAFLSIRCFLSFEHL